MEVTNKSIAETFYKIAELLELKGRVSPFEIRAYQNSARAIEFLSDDIVNIYNSSGIDGLKNIEGIGDTSAHHIIEILKSGKLSKLDDLIKLIPRAKLEFIEIPGVGPKLTNKLFEITQARSRKDLLKKLTLALNKPSSALRKKLEQSSIRDKTISNIIGGIATVNNQSGRLLLSQAMPIANDMVEYMAKCEFVNHVNYAGSLRRHKETIGDIDIIASLKSPKTNPSDVIKYFCQYPQIKKIINQGKTKARIIHNSYGAQVDFEILPNTEYGSLLQHFTGSKEHNVELRTYALSKGLSMSEHGFKKIQRLKLKSQKHNSKNVKTIMIKCSSEQCVYQTLRLEYIPPELREGQGEIQAAISRSIPKLVDLEDILGDLQIHSVFSDGKCNLEQLANRANKLNYQYIALTDHSAGLGITGGISKTNYKKYLEIISKFNLKQHYIKVLSGVEVNIKADGTLDLPDTILKQFDIVAASIHSSFKQSKDVVTKRLSRAIVNSNVDFIAHPTGRIIDKRDEINADWELVFKLAKTKNVAFEINSQPSRLDLPVNLIKLANKFGVNFIISTDSHDSDQLDNIVYGVSMARRGWLTKDNILNTMKFDKFNNWLKSR